MKISNGVNKKISTPITIIIISACAVFAAGLALWQYFYPQQIEISEITLPEKSAPQTETADWNTYRNEEYGFEIKYPESWVILENPPIIEFTNKENLSEKIEILISSGPPPETMREKIIEDEIISVDREKAFKALFQGKFEDNKGQYYIRVFIPGKEIFYHADFTAENKDIFLSVFNQILSTFRFLEKNSSGTIEGSLAWPSEKIPADMRICAENIETKERYCTDSHIKDSKYRYGEGYKINVPIGNYYVYATLLGWDQFYSSDWIGYKAYYSEFVTCGLKIECPSHKPIKVIVRAGDTIENIDPQDWYK